MAVKFVNQNSKLRSMAKELRRKFTELWTFDLVAGVTCPAALLCRSRFDRETSKIVDYPSTRFRCYAATMEAISPAASRLHWKNFESLKGKTTRQMYEEITTSLPKTARIVRIHASGDFFNQDYFLAWVRVAKNNPHITFYGYTKVLKYVEFDKPGNFKLVYSMGGKFDEEALSKNTPHCRVVKTTEEAEKYNLPVLCQEKASDDFFHIMAGISFALLVHGTQPKKR